MGCDDYAQWVRVHKGELFTLCTKHHALLGRKKWGKHLDVSKLSEDDIRYLVGKERRKESARRHPFDVRMYPLEDGTTKIKVRDRKTCMHGEIATGIPGDINLDEIVDIYDAIILAGHFGEEG